MYGALLIVVKIFSDALTAASGIFGLLTEFKDDQKRITRSGKVALIGIIVGFGMSWMIAYLEFQNSQDENAKHEEEVKRLQRPLDDHMYALMVLSVPKNAPRSSHYRPRLVAYFKKLMANHVKPDPSIPVFLSVPDEDLQAFVLNYSQLPAAFRADNSDLVEIFDQSIAYSIQLFRSATCESLNNSGQEADLELGFDDISLKNDQSVTWQYVANNDSLAMSRNLKLWISRSTSRFTSVEDFQDSTMVVWMGPADREFSLEDLTINLRGVSFEVNNFTHIHGGGGRQFELPQNAARLHGRRFIGYCYEIPKDEFSR